MAELDIQTILERYNPWWRGHFKAVGIARESYLEKLKSNLKNNQIIFITGLRRVGKTTLIKQFIERIIEKENINGSAILFVSLDDPAFVSMSLRAIVEEFRKINSLHFEDRILLFFDEISYKENFSMELKSMRDNQNVKIFASGSNSLQMMDKKAFLTGRVFNIKVNPLDFEEYLKFREVSLSPIDKHLLEKNFEDYLKIGGMPEYVLTKNPEFIRTVIEDAIYKDIARTKGIRNVDKLKELFILLCERVGKRISYNKLSKIIGIDKETVAEYISCFCQTFLFSVVSRYSKSLNERVYSNKKVYISDNGIRNIFVDFKDKGSLFENLVFNEISKKTESVFYYYENDNEIDFIVKLPLKKVIAVEVKYGKIDDEDIKSFEKMGFKNKVMIKNYEELKKLLLKL